MSRQILFNGALLTRPGAYTRIDASQFNNVALLGLGVVGLIGDADGGPPRVPNVFNNAQAVKTVYRSGDLVEAAGMVADPSNDPLVPTGAQVIVCYKTNDSAQASLIHDVALSFKSRDWGLHTNSIQVGISSSGGSLRVVQIKGLDQLGNLITETSPEFGDPAKYGKFSLQYTGSGDPATVTITATHLTTACTGATGDNLNIALANYPTLTDLVFYLNGLPAYTATALITNAASFDPTTLDAVSGGDILTTARTLLANNFDLANWVDTNSSLVSCTLIKGEPGPVDALPPVALSGGTIGASDNTAWATAFTRMGGVRVNQLVTLASEDGSVSGKGTYTIASVNAGLQTHCQLMSSTIGKSERQGWASVKATKTNLIAAAVALNSEHVCMTGQKMSRLSSVSGDIIEFPEWATAAVFAGMRAGAPLGEPLTHKIIKASAMSNDSSWSTLNANDIVDLLLNGVMFATQVQGVGFRIEKGITTYLKSDNDAFTEESIVQNWKLIAYSWRTALEQRYTGRPMDVGTVQTVRPFSNSVLSGLRDQGVITDSLVDGQQTPGFRNITVQASGDVINVSGEVSPTSGINFILNTAILVPAQFSI